MAIENLTAYTKVDPDGKLTVTSPKVAAAGADGMQTRYVIKDFGASFFDAIDVYFEISVSSATGTSEVLGGFSIGNTSAPYFGNASLVGISIGADRRQGIDCRMFFFYNAFSNLQLLNISADTPYYCRLERSAGSNSATLKVYSDSGHTSLVSTLTISGIGTTKYQYSVAFLSYLDGNTSSAFTGYVQNIDLQLAPPFIAVPNPLPKQAVKRASSY